MSYSLYSSIIVANVIVLVGFLGATAVVTPVFLIEIILICTCIGVQTHRHDKGKDSIKDNHGWMCILALCSGAIAVGIGSALVSLIASTENPLAQCIIWFFFAFMLSSMLRMTLKMAEWSVDEDSRAIFAFAVIFADDFFSELVFALIGPFTPMFFVLVFFCVVRNIIRDIGGFDFIIRYICIQNLYCARTCTCTCTCKCYMHVMCCIVCYNIIIITIIIIIIIHLILDICVAVLVI